MRSEEVSISYQYASHAVLLLIIDLEKSVLCVTISIYECKPRVTLCFSTFELYLMLMLLTFLHLRCTWTAMLEV